MSGLSTTTKKFRPVHPGLILAEDLADVGIRMNQLAKAIHVPNNRISAIVKGQRSIKGDTAVRLSLFWHDRRVNPNTHQNGSPRLPKTFG
jgi:addiction module HigA family antidote